MQARVFRFFYYSGSLGPTVILYGKMWAKTPQLGAVLLVLLPAYGFALKAILFPDTPFDHNLLGITLLRPFANIFNPELESLQARRA